MMKNERPAFHENALPFGPCEADTRTGLDRSWFCQGAGTETLDPLSPFSLDTVIVCGPCRSMRESQVIETNTLTLINDMEATA